MVRDAGLSGLSILQSEGEMLPDIPGATVTGVDRIRALGLTFELVHVQFR